MSPRARARAAAWSALVIALSAAVAEAPWCRDRPARPRVELAAAAEGPLRAGAARVDVPLPFPVVVAGYGPPRPLARTALLPVRARALVLEEGGVRFGLVTLDLLTFPESLSGDVRAATAGLGLTDVWCAATHSHSSAGAYERTLLSELAGTGPFRQDVHDALVGAAASALRAAVASLAPASLSLGEALLPAVQSRNEVPEVDARLTRALLRGPKGLIGQLVLLAAHPTLQGRHEPVLEPDYPGWLADALDQAQGGVSLVLQSAVGNAGFQRVTPWDAPRTAALELSALVERLPTREVPAPPLSLARATVDLPAPDARRLVPAWARGAGDNFLCANAPAHASLGLLRLGPLRLLTVPGEPTSEAARALEEAAGGARVVGLVGGYLGYVEDPARVARAEGEARRQYFPPELLRTLALAAEQDRAALDEKDVAFRR